MFHPSADVDMLQAKDVERLLQSKATYKEEITNTAEYLNKKYKENQFVNAVTSHDSNKLHMYSESKTSAKVVEELNHSNKNNATKKEGIQYTIHNILMKA